MNAVRELGIIAGKGVYPLELARSARKQGVNRIFAIAFKGETSREISRLADEVTWLRVGLLDAFLEALRATGVHHFVMAGQITPSNLFHARLDKRMVNLLRSLPAWNAHTIFGTLCNEIRAAGIDLLPAHQFMRAALAEAGVMTTTPPTSQQEQDIALGIRVAGMSSEFEIGQTVVVKDGVILAVEAFEGTDQAILRAGKLGGPGGVVVKRAKTGHDMRFDIPVIGMKTIKTLRRAKIAALALEAGRTILLEKTAVIEAANRLGMCMLAFPAPGTISVGAAASRPVFS